MVFISICTALYDYAPQADNELAIREGELIYVLEKSTEDDWWKAKKRARSEDEEEPVGLIPYNYVEEVSVVSFRGMSPIASWASPVAGRPGLPSTMTLTSALFRHNPPTTPKHSMTIAGRQTRSSPSRRMRSSKFTITRQTQNGPWWV